MKIGGVSEVKFWVVLPIWFWQKIGVKFSFLPFLCCKNDIYLKLFSFLLNDALYFRLLISFYLLLYLG